uniref:Uncharacterized protein n=1 Tax=Lepeophtheirus salmonis TaxID=72036 RepID=A0A0K2U1G2_LEPSM
MPILECLSQTKAIKLIGDLTC